MKPLTKLMPLAVSALVLAGCTPPCIHNSSNGMPTLTSLGIQDARSLFIAGQTSGQYRIASGPTQQALYKVDASGAVSAVEAKFGSGSGYMMLSLNPQYVTQISENFIVLGTSWGTFLVRRTDGKSARLDSTPTYVMSDGMQAPVQADKIGNIYLNSHQEGLYKVALPTELTSDDLTKTSMIKGELELVQQFAVNHAGYLVATVSPKSNGPMNPKTRLYKPSGSVQNLSTSGQFGGGSMWVAKDGTLYMHAYGSSGPALHMLSVDASGNGTLVPVEGWTEPSYMSMPYNMPALLPDQTVLSGNEYSRETNEQHPNGIDLYKPYLFFVKGAKATKEYLTKVVKVSAIAASATTVVILGTDQAENTMVSSFDPVTKEEKVLFSDANYQILKMTVAANGTVTLNALRLADNTYVVADIKDGALAVANSELPPVKQFLTLQ